MVLLHNHEVDQPILDVTNDIRSIKMPKLYLKKKNHLNGVGSDGQFN